MEAREIDCEDKTDPQSCSMVSLCVISVEPVHSTTRELICFLTQPYVYRDSRQARNIRTLGTTLLPTY